MKFDTIIQNGGHVFGLLFGSSPCFVIKVGAGGSIYGHENKYLKLAYWLNEQYGSSVIVSDTPVDMEQTQDFCAAMDYVLAQNSSKVFYIGISRGAQEAAALAWRYSAIEKMLLINMPMMINWHKSKAGLQQLSCAQHCTLAFGTKDPSYPYIPFAQRLASDNIKVVELGSLGHQLSTDNTQLADLIRTVFD